MRNALRRFPWGELKYVLWLPVYLLSFFVIERVVVTGYRPTQTWLDAYIPFCEWFVIPYCLWYPLLVAVGLWLLWKDREGFHRYMRFLALTFFASALIWFLIPNGQDLRPAVMLRDNPLTRLVEGLYSIDTNTNVFPSVHVVGAIGAAWAVKKTPSLERRTLLRGATAILALLICLSTLFIKQHGILDLLIAVPYSIAMYFIVYRLIFRRREKPAAGS
ncbi:MAG: phosphatase PAP2 family protein [Clostridiales bacterium]|nr:phosphatase PAP2 family protein [Clostridiales bacterium]